MRRGGGEDRVLSTRGVLVALAFLVVFLVHYEADAHDVTTLTNSRPVSGVCRRTSLLFFVVDTKIP